MFSLFWLFWGCVTTLSAESWNILVFMAADNNLYSNALLDFNAMESVDLPAGVRVYLQTDFPDDSPYPGGRRWRLTHNDSNDIYSTELDDLGTISSGSPETLNDFIRWGLERYNADRTMLVIWSHGDSWYKGLNSKWICSDDDAQSVLSVSNGDLKAAFEGIPKLDILLFDACSMQTIEVLTEISETVDYVIGSEDLVPDTGFPYETLLPLFSGSLESILQAIPDVYTESYEAFGSQNPYTQGLQTTCSVVRTDLIPNFNLSLRQSLYLLHPFAPKFLELRNTCWEMNTGYNEIDLKELLDKAAEADFGSLELWQLGELRAIWAACVVSSSAIEYEHELGTAVIWFPSNRQAFETSWRMYHNLDFAQWDWLSLLNLAWGEDVSPPQSVASVTTHNILSTLLLSFSPVKDPDRLSYHIQITGQTEEISYWLPDPVDGETITQKIAITAPGTYSIYTVDRSDNSSETISGSFAGPSPEQGLRVAPNPVRDRSKAMVYWQKPDERDETAFIGIYNLRGQQLAGKTLDLSINNTGSYSLGDLDGFNVLPHGLYLIRLRLGKSDKYSKVLIQ